MPHPEFTLLGDAIWLDFVNTARGRTSSPPDLLPDSAGFARWARAQQLEPGSPPALLPVIREFRARLTAMAEALHAGTQPPPGAITAINQHLVDGAGIQQLTRVGGEWRLQFAPARSLAALEAVARSAAMTLADPLIVVRRCAGPTCSLFFTDATPTGSRRWCSAVPCGHHLPVDRRRGVLR